MSERSVRVRVPATSANLGPGFDALGIACTLYNEMTLTLTHEPGLHISARGEGAAYIPCDERNIVWKSIQYLLQRAGCAEEFQGARIRMSNRIPLSRGLGSSATAIVAGLTAANALIDSLFSRDDLLQLATDIEGHPDNVAPAIYGGFTVNTVTNGRVEFAAYLSALCRHGSGLLSLDEICATGVAGRGADEGCRVQYQSCGDDGGCTCTRFGKASR